MSSKWKEIPLSKVLQGGDPTSYLVDGIIEEGSLNVFYGHPGGYKTMILMDMAVCVAAGVPWLPDRNGEKGFRTTQAPVTWIDHDSGYKRVLKRFHALMKARGLTEDIPLHIFSPTDHVLNASNRFEIEELYNEQFYDMENGLVVIDTLSLISGDTDENSAQMKVVMSNLRNWATSCNCAITPIHHQRKGRNDGRNGDSLRGHSSIEAALDLAVQVSKNKMQATLSPTKVRGAEIAYETIAEFCYTHKPGTTDLDTAIFYTVRSAEKKVRETVDISRVLIDIINDSEMPLNKTSAQQAAYEFLKTSGDKVSEAQVRRELQILMDSGIIVDFPSGKRNERILSVVE